MRCLKLTYLFKDSLRNIFIYTKVYKMLIPKSIKCQSNLTESEIRAYFSLKPLDEDYEVHQKRFNKVISEYLQVKEFKNANAKACYKSQLKTLIKEGKTNTPKFSAFNMWRLKEIEKNISRQKTYLLKAEGKVMPKRPEPVENNNNELIHENKKLKLEIEKLKKQLIEKDNQIDFLMKQNEIKEEVKEEVKEEIVINFDSEEESDEEDEEEIYVDVIDAVEDLVNNVISLRDALDDSDEESEEEEEETPKQKVSKKEAIEIFHKICIDKIPQYHEEYMKLKEGKNDKETCKIKNDIFDRYDDEVIQPNVEKLDDVYDLPNEEFTQVQEKPYEKMKDMILYFSG
eukprot:COSAG02_NODE_313_length_24939_cov_470.394485_6_plen_343_part_00